MTIVHTCLRYPPASGGAETYVKEIVERTKNTPDGFIRDVRVLTSKMRTHGPITELDPELLLDDPVYVQRLHHIATPFISYPRLQALKYYLGHHRPDIIHGYGFWYQPADVSARYAAKHHIPFILHPLYYTREKPVWKFYQHTIGNKTFDLADVVIVISPYEQKLIEQAGFPARRFELIPPGVDFAKFARPRLNPFLKRKISGKILFSAGRLAEGKGLDEAINALPEILRSHGDVQLVLAGENFGFQSRLVLLAAKLGVGKYVHFPGKLPEEELIAAFQHADILVHPSRYEAFGIVLAESLAAGTPVVARNASAIPFVAPHERAGLLFNTPAELSAHVKTLLGQPNLRHKLGRQGKKHVEENFSWDKSINKILNLYEDLIP